MNDQANLDALRAAFCAPDLDCLRAFGLAFMTMDRDPRLKNSAS
jgi:hypothetical protein